MEKFREPQEATRSGTYLGRVVLAISLFSILVVWVIILLTGLDERDRQAREGRDELSRMSQIVAEQTRHVLLVSRLFLQLADDWIQHNPGDDPRFDPEFSRMVQSLRRNLKGHVDIQLANKSGFLDAIPDPEDFTTTSPRIQTWTEYRNQLRLESFPPLMGIAIGSPVKNPQTKLWVLPISLPLSRSNSGYSQIVALIDLPYLQSIFETTRPKSIGDLDIYRNDGRLLVSSRISESIPHPQVGTSLAWQKFYSTSMYGAAYIPGDLDAQPPRVAAWLRAPDFPLVFVVSRDSQTAGNEWLRLMFFRSALTLVMTIVVILLLFHLFRLIHVQEASRRELESIARVDTLTGLLNRRYLLFRTNEELHRAGRYKRPISIAMLDIDHFKMINDQLGHAAGDEALKAFSRALVASLRTSDLVGRIGGEEFVVVMPETALGPAREICERMRAGISGVVTPQGHLSASIGLAAWKGDPESLQDLLKRADKAMYAAKQAGRNRVVTDLEVPAGDDLEIEIPGP